MSGAVHRAAREGFGSAAGAYERGRPDFPREAIAFIVETLRLGPGRRVLDLGAGTGKLTRMLVPSGAALFGLEPVEAMRDVMRRAVPDATPVGAVAEAIPFRDGSIDAVTGAQAFHWFHAERTAVEIRRVLVRGGRVAAVWNVRDESVPWVAELTRIMEPHRGDTPTHRRPAWREGFDRADSGFTPLELTTFRHVHRLTREGVVERVLSVSFIAALPGDERERVTDQVRALLDDDPDTRGRDEIELPYRTDVWVTERG